MTAEQIAALNNFTKKASSYMREAEVRRTQFLRDYEVVIHTDIDGYKVVEQFLISAPINMVLLLTEVASLQDATKKSFELSKENDAKAGLVEPSELTKQLEKITTGQLNKIEVFRGVQGAKEIRVEIPPGNA